MKFYKIAFLLAAGGALLSFGGCARWALDALYVLPQFSDFFNSVGGAAT